MEKLAEYHPESSKAARVSGDTRAAPGLDTGAMMSVAMIRDSQ